MIELTVQQMVGVTNYKPKNHCAKKKRGFDYIREQPDGLRIQI